MNFPNKFRIWNTDGGRMHISKTIVQISDDRWRMHARSLTSSENVQQMANECTFHNQ